MALKKSFVTVAVHPHGDPDPDACLVVEKLRLITADQVKAEQMMRQRNLGKITDSPVTAQYVMVWHALTREGHYTGNLDAFLGGDLLDVDDVGGEPLDPTREPSGSDYSSRTSSTTPDSGSIPPPPPTS